MFWMDQSQAETPSLSRRETSLPNVATMQEFDRTIGIHSIGAEEFVTMRSVTRVVREQGAE